MPASGKAKLARSTRKPERAHIRARLLYFIFADLLAAAAMTPATADDVPYNPRTTYGEVGMLDMPSSRMSPEGDIGFTIAAIQGTQHYNASLQLLPWLEASFRYSHINKYVGLGPLYDRSFGLKVRLFQETRYTPEVSLGFRDVLGTGAYAGEYLVASKRWDDLDFSLGVGWGRFAQSNALPNPFAAVFSSFKTRPVFNQTTGVVNFGEFFHGPKIGVFGGAIWHSPIENLDVIVEYSSDRYDRERESGDLTERTPVNIGLSYRAYDTVTVSAGWYYGATAGLTLTFTANPMQPLSPIRLGPDIPQPYIRSVSDQTQALSILLARKTIVQQRPASNGPWVNVDDQTAGERELVGALLNEGVGVRNAEKDGHTLLVEAALTRSSDVQCDSYAKIAAGFDVALDTVAVSNMDDDSGAVIFCPIAHRASRIVAAADANPTSSPAPIDIAALRAKILADVAAQNLHVEALSIETGALWLYYSNGLYASEDQAAGRIARVLMADAPPNIELFHLISVKLGLPMREFQIARTALERAATTYGSIGELGQAVQPQLPPLSNPLLDRAQDETFPRFHWAVGPGLREGLFDPDRPLEVQLFASADASVEITPHFTAEVRLEAKIADNISLARLSDSLLPHVRSDTVQYFRYGANGITDLRMIYRNRIAPDIYIEGKAGYLESMFAGAGGQILWRPENSRFALGVDAYEVWQRNFDRLFGVQHYHVLTGHVSLYYASPWYGLNFNIHAGRYLAGDYGATFEISRRFSTGVEIGAFATFTNVPFAKFGEGSFDKGIIVHIPFEWVLPFHSQSSYDLLLRSLTRDGGQRLDQDDSLYDDTRSTSFGDIVDDLGSIVAP